MRSIFLALVILIAPVANADRDDDPNPAPNEEGVTRRCEAAIDKAAGHFSRCLLKASAKFARNDDADSLAAKQAKCEDRFNEAFDEAIEQFPGQCTRLREPIIERTVSYAEEVATEAGGEVAAEILFVQHANDTVLTDSTLTLTGVSPQISWVVDDPYRAAGQIAIDEYVSQWYEGNVDAAPPTADLTFEVDGEVVDVVVKLSSPVLDGDDLSYAVEVIGDASLPAAPLCDILQITITSIGSHWPCPAHVVACAGQESKHKFLHWVIISEQWPAIAPVLVAIRFIIIPHTRSVSLWSLTQGTQCSSRSQSGPRTAHSPGRMLPMRTDVMPGACDAYCHPVVVPEPTAAVGLGAGAVALAELGAGKR